MQARETQLLTLLAGQHQFVIPIFQRDYSWGGEECKRLVDDVLAVAPFERSRDRAIIATMSAKSSISAARSSWRWRKPSA